MARIDHKPTQYSIKSKPSWFHYFILHPYTHDVYILTDSVDSVVRKGLLDCHSRSKQAQQKRLKPPNCTLSKK